MKKCLLSFLFIAISLLKINAQTGFTTGNICVLQVGDSTSSLTDTGNTVIFREFSPSGTPTNWYVVPNAPANKALILSGTSTTEGCLALSNDSSSLTFIGFSQVLAGNLKPLKASSSSVVPRAIGRVTGCGKYDRIAQSTTFFSGADIRGAASDGCSENYWSSGASGGVNYFGAGTPTNIENDKANLRAILAQYSNLYFSTQSLSGSITNYGIYKVGTGLPTASGQTISNVIVTGTTSNTALATNTNTNPCQFYFNSTETICYVADINSTANGGGIHKWVKTAGVWSKAYIINIGGSAGAFSVICDFNGANPTCYAVTNETSTSTKNKLVRFVDNGTATPTIITLATCPTNCFFRGIAFSPKTMQVNTSSVTQPVCGSNLGSASFNTVSGYCTPVYSIFPNVGTQSTAGNFTNLPSTTYGSTYTIISTDVSGCTLATTLTLIDPNNIVLTKLNKSIKCYGGMGTIKLFATGGTLPYQYKLNAGSFGSVDSFNVTKGIYTLTVQDANGCSKAIIDTLIQPDSLYLNIYPNIIYCVGGTTKIDCIAGGGITPYTYSLNNGTPQSIDSFSNLSTGSYSVIVRDANNCSAFDKDTITPANVFNLYTFTENITCNGGKSYIQLYPDGGNGSSFQYSLNGAAFITVANDSFTNLNTGTYTVICKDNFGCTASSIDTITQPTNLIATKTSTSILCNSGFSTFTINASGGTAPYQYKINTNSFQTSNIFNSNVAGNYTFTIKDVNNCIAFNSFTITQPDSLKLPIAYQLNNKCFGDSTGIAKLNTIGGIAPYTYNWIGGAVNHTDSIYNVAAGNYTCTVTDANSCTAKKIVALTQPTKLFATISYLPIPCNGDSILVTTNGTGGITPYTSTLPTYKKAGTYTFSVTDFNNCTASKIQTITQPNILTATINATSIKCFGDSSTITVSPNGGTAPYSINGNNIMPAGSYSYIVTDAKNCTAQNTITITQPNILTATINTTAIKCFGDSSTISVSANGGTAPFSISGNNIMPAGSYTYIITDAKNCTTQNTITLTQPNILTATINATAIKCFGDSSTISVLPNGGTAPYSISGNNIIPADSYTYIVTDAKNCTAQEIITLTQPNVLTATINATAIKCFGDSSTISVSANGGTAPFSVIGNNIVPVGSYTYIVTDANNCTAQDTITLTQPNVFTATTTISNYNCSSDSAIVLVNATGGTLPYSGNGNITYPIGTINKNVLDAKGCNANYQITINPIPVKHLVLTATSQVICSNSSTSLNAYLQNGSAATTYNWQNNLYTDSAIVVAPSVTTTYTAQATDGSCTYTDTFYVATNSASTDLALSTGLVSYTGTTYDSLVQANGMQISFYDASCHLIANILDANGGNELGIVDANVTVDASVQTLNNQPYVARHYHITPQNNGPATVTLYFTQADFDSYNAHPNVVNNLYPPFPTSGNNADPNIANIRVAVYHGNATLGSSNNQDITPTSVTYLNGIWSVVFNIDSFSRMYLHGKNPNNAALSVDEFNLTASKQSNFIALNFTTLNEKNTDYFKVLHSTDATHFTEVDKIFSKANNNNTEKLFYEYKHINPVIGSNYYQIAQINTDGKTLMSNIAKVNYSNEMEIKIYPNPVTDNIYIQAFTLKATHSTIQLIYATGKIIITKDVIFEKGNNQISIPIENIASGIYSLIIRDAKGFVVTQRLQKL